MRRTLPGVARGVAALPDACLVRATLVTTIYGRTSEIQRNIIAKTLGL